MSLDVPVSRCCKGVRLDFIWYCDEPSQSHAAVDSVLREFEIVMHRPGLLWSPYSWPMARAEFRKVLLRGMEGDLKPVDHVKKIDPRHNEFLFEIRWPVPALEQLEDGTRVHRDVLVRFYHGEPAELDFTFVGVHLHEKVIVPGDDAATNRLQNIEIEVAISRYLDGVSTLWK